MSNLQHPCPGDNNRGTELAWRDEPDQFEILTWYEYSSGDGEFRAILTRWSLDHEDKAIDLEGLSKKEQYSPWSEDLSHVQSLIPDRHRRMARDIGREKFGMQRFRKLRL